MAAKPTYAELEQQVKKLEIALGVVEQKKAIDTFSIKERCFKELIRNSSDSIAILNKDGLQTYVNDAVEKHLGFKPHEVINISVIEEMIHADDRQKVLTAFQKTIKHGEGGVQYRHKHKNGSWVYLEAWCKNQLNNPDIQGVVVNIRNITEWKKTEEALKTAEETYRNMFLNSQTGLFRTDINTGLLLDANDALAQFLGYKDRNELLSELFSIEDRYIDSKDREKMLSILMEDGEFKNLETPFRHNDGSTIWVRFSGKLISDKGWIEGVSEDITKEKLANEEAKKSQKKFQNIMENMTDGLTICDKDGHITFMNTSGLKQIGYTLKEVLGKTPLELFIGKTDSPKFIKDLKIVLSGKILTGEHYQAKRKNGDLFPASVNLSALYDNEKRVLSLIAIHRDITMEKIAIKREKYALVGQIAGKMAHDFNNVLAVIMGNAQLALIDIKDTKIRKTLELIFNQTIRGKNLTKNLIAFAKDQEPKQEFFKLSEKIELVFNLLKKDLQGIECVKIDKPGVPDLLADPGMIEHALVNLVQNSIHAISMVKQPKIIITTFHKDKNIYIEIEDNGCGIPKEALDKVYEPAFTMKGSKDMTNSYEPEINGTGYGMANVKKYIEQHKGNIVIDSNIEKGTKVTISFPFIKKALTEKEVIEIKKKTFASEKYILLVEDELALSDIQYKILTHEPCNHKVDIAATGQMAIDLFNRNEYDFISLDYILPGGLNGMDVYDHVRKTNKTVPILFVSGNIEFLESIKELQHKDANVGHISKPCQNTDYVDSINKLLEYVL